MVHIISATVLDLQQLLEYYRKLKEETNKWRSILLTTFHIPGQSKTQEVNLTQSWIDVWAGSGEGRVAMRCPASGLLGVGAGRAYAPNKAPKPYAWRDNILCLFMGNITNL
jgi:hypothetical protein